MQNFHRLIFNSEFGIKIPVSAKRKRLWKNGNFGALFLGFLGH
jgi:hypothetical protein